MLAGEYISRNNANDKSHYRALSDAVDQIYRGIKMLDTHRHEWLVFGKLKLRAGRGWPDCEVTIVCDDYSVMRSLLTVAALGWYDRHPTGDTRMVDSKLVRSREPVRPDAWMSLVKRVIDMLEKSSDRRENTWSYRDKPISEIMALPWAEGALRSRRAAIFSDIHFRKVLDEIISGVRGHAAT